MSCATNTSTKIISLKASYSQVSIAAINTSHAFFVAADETNRIWAGLVSLENLMTKVIPIGVGSDPSIAITQGHAFLTVGSGFCYNSYTHNTQCSPLLCDQSPLATEWTLDYYFGVLEAWIDRFLLQYPSKQHNEVHSSSLWWTPCDDTILHGSFSPWGRSLLLLSIQASLHSHSHTQLYMRALLQVQPTTEHPARLSATMASYSRRFRYRPYDRSWCLVLASFLSLRKGE